MGRSSDGPDTRGLRMDELRGCIGVRGFKLRCRRHPRRCTSDQHIEMLSWTDECNTNPVVDPSGRAVSSNGAGQHEAELAIVLSIASPSGDHYSGWVFADNQVSTADCDGGTGGGGVVPGAYGSVRNSRYCDHARLDIRRPA